MKFAPILILKLVNLKKKCQIFIIFMNSENKEIDLETLFSEFSKSQ